MCWKLIKNEGYSCILLEQAVYNVVRRCMYENVKNQSNDFNLKACHMCITAKHMYIPM
jgi:hypothetical protein